ncbi:MAG TPA: hypothetical protein QGH10_12600 [Armatimonadota bacterium]|nr:hypothetical protein [Armatimonadota bacterium]
MSAAISYLDVLDANIDTVIDREWGNLTRAVGTVAQALADGRVAYEYLAGHLMPGEAGPGRRGRPDVFQTLDKAAIGRLKRGDVVVMTHQYGVHKSYIDVALPVKDSGATIIAVAPRSDPARILRTHPSGKTVIDLAEIVIDTHIPAHDAAVDLPAGGPGACPTSGVVQAMIHWALVCGVAERLAESDR